MNLSMEPISGVAAIILSTFLVLTSFTNGQYETPNHMCGGWFKSVQGSIKFKFTPNENETTNLRDQVCAWTVSGSLANQFSRYDISIQQIPGYSCDPLTSTVGVSHFSLHAQDVTATETWSCGGPQTWRAVPGTVFIVVFKSRELRNMTGFQLDWAPSGAILQRNGVRTTAYSWGKHSVEPLRYYASGFFREEVATHVFPKGNGTQGYALEMVFTTLDLTQCGPVSNPCEGANSSLLVLEIKSDARLQLGNRYTAVNLTEPTDPIRSEWGLVILVWGGDFWGSGGRFQMTYRSTILSLDN